MELESSFKEVLRYSQGFQKPNVSQLLTTWREAKSWFIQKFNGNYIWESPEPIIFTLGPEERRKGFNAFLNQVPVDLANFLKVQGIDAFFNNKTVTPYNSPSIPVGSKILKAFKYFLPEDKVSYYQDLASTYLQENHFSGILCFSVHPLDFLSLSETNLDWRSCHALDGEYRCGDLTYMTDKTTLICYIKSAQPDSPLPNFGSVSWNSKKWRQLVHFNDDNYDAMVANKQYPFSLSESNLELVRRTLVHDALGFSRWSCWHDDQIVQATYSSHNEEDHCACAPILNFGGRFATMISIIHNHPESRHYSDIFYSSTPFKPYYSWKKWGYNNAPDIKKLSFTIGAPAPCICCGESAIASTDSMFCADCELLFGNSEDEELFPHCACCDKKIWHEDANWEDGKPYCENCYDERNN